jgi:hypothetical protein
VRELARQTEASTPASLNYKWQLMICVLPTQSVVFIICIVPRPAPRGEMTAQERIPRHQPSVAALSTKQAAQCSECLQVCRPARLAI